MTIFAPIFNTIDVSKYRCFLFDVSYPSMVAIDVNTDIEHRCLCSMSHPYCCLSDASLGQGMVPGPDPDLLDGQSVYSGLVVDRKILLFS
jgi:hypothetical protein